MAVNMNIMYGIIAVSIVLYIVTFSVMIVALNKFVKLIKSASRIHTDYELEDLSSSDSDSNSSVVQTKKSKPKQVATVSNTSSMTDTNNDDVSISSSDSDSSTTKGAGLVPNDELNKILDKASSAKWLAIGMHIGSNISMMLFMFALLVVI